LRNPENGLIFATANKDGTIAQLVEQRTENPCVPGSIPGGTTQKREASIEVSLFLLPSFLLFILPLFSLHTKHKAVENKVSLV
jgi:hypothetical protein